MVDSVAIQAARSTDQESKRSVLLGWGVMSLNYVNRSYYAEHTQLVGRLTSKMLFNLSLKTLAMDLELHGLLGPKDSIDPNLQVLFFRRPLLYFSVDVFPLQSAHAIFLEPPFLKSCRVLVFPIWC